MVRPWLLDLVDCALPIVLGCAWFFVGRQSKRVAVPLASVLAVSVLMGLLGWVPSWAAACLSHCGGPSALGAWFALVLLGAASVAPNRQSSNTLLVFYGVVTLVLIAATSAGTLWWRCAERDSWLRTADSSGCLRQSKPQTCGATSAVMLLHNQGIIAGEGEIAYLARTSLFGADAIAVAEALTWKTADRGWHGEVRREPYAVLAERGAPFVAVIRLGIRGHCLFVENITAADVTCIDPLEGVRKSMPRAAFERIWLGTAVVLEKGGGD